MAIDESLLLRNHADIEGGAMALFFGVSAELRNSTVAGNTSGFNAGGIGLNSGSVVLENVTLVGNHTDGTAGAPAGNGGGVSVNPVPSATFEIQNTIIAGNTDGAATKANDCSGPVTSNGNSLVRDQTNCTYVAGPDDLAAGTDPRLRPLANNGGPTQTHALRPGSPRPERGCRVPLPRPARGASIARRGL